MKFIYKLQRALILSIVLTVVSPIIAKAGPSGSAGGFKYKTAKIALKMATEDIIEFLPYLSHQKLNAERKEITKQALQNLVMEPQGKPRYRNGELLFMDFEKEPVPKIIATESFFKKYQSITAVSSFRKNELYFQIRKDLLHEVAHIILDSEEELKNPEEAAEEFTNNIRINYRKNIRLITTKSPYIEYTQEIVNLFKPNDLSLLVRSFPKNLAIKLSSVDLNGIKYEGALKYSISDCNLFLTSHLSLVFNGTDFTGTLYSIPKKYETIDCSEIRNYQEWQEIAGYIKQNNE